MKWCFFAFAVLLVACDDAATAPEDTVDAEVIVDGLCEHTGQIIAPEQCDGRDNDCDDAIDEDFDLSGDPNTCGGCNIVCDFDNAIALCDQGRCVMGGCPAGWADVDGISENGCEAACDATPGPELCDGRDNDCDGRTDEDYDTDVDLNHCGGCGLECAFAQADALCDGGACRLARCQQGWGNINGDDSDGCEAMCDPANPGPERCDGEDNDCDGEIDETFDLEADGENCGACGVRCAYANALGACDEGDCVLRACEAGFVDADGRLDNGCESACQVTQGGVEICDEIDNDCNGIIDDGIDTQSDVLNCGGCGNQDEIHICRLPNAEVGCVDGVCTVDSCTPGFVDVDGEPLNGCETACEPTGEDICDRTDNDCDGRVDEDFDLGTDLDNCGACGTSCAVENAEVSCVRGRCQVSGCPEGRVDADLNPANGCEYECVRDGADVCDLTDNDCDTRVDEGFDTSVDLEHCGACDSPCAPPHGIAICLDGVCDMAGCEDGYFDFNGDLEDGCEIECTPSETGLEVCDTVDNDCDAEIDEGFDLSADPNHCGACGVECRRPNTEVGCVESECTYGGCLPGWSDANGDSADGCEYACTVTEDPTEICDGIDNNCDGQIDEGFEIGSLEHCGGCNIVCAAQNAVMACDEGVCRIAECAPEFVDIDGNPVNGCEANCVPTGDETCDDTDNDCDGRTDEGFNKQADVNHCGGCGVVCELSDATPFCNNGSCAVLSCADGFVDTDRQPGNGCECGLTNGGVEICDGLDNDCNGIADDPERLSPPVEARCLNRGVCRGIQPVCANAAWSCTYPDGYEAVETSCDHADNDCDGIVDETFPELGRPCADGIGACRVEGVIDCQGADATACTAEAQPNEAAESCNDIDDDCDGTVDEGSQELVAIPAGNGVAAFTIFAHEASRTDADALDPGNSFARACSKPGALPWVNVDYATAVAACDSIGMRLCSGDEWGRACGTQAETTFPYGNAYEANTCNGVDFDTDANAAGNQDTAVPTFSLDQCVASWPDGSVSDLSGNVWEWTSDDVSLGGDGSARALRGGSYGNVSGGLTCGYSLATPSESFRQNIGFRCCAD